jgi:hypothetical protein
MPNNGNKIPTVGQHRVNVKDKPRLSSTNDTNGLLNLLNAVDIGMSMINPPRREYLRSNADVPGVPHVKVASDVHAPIRPGRQHRTNGGQGLD